MTSGPSSSLKKSRSSSRKKLTPTPPSPSPSPSSVNSTFETNLEWSPLEVLDTPSSTYLKSLEQVKEFRRLIQEELTYINEELQRTKGKSGRSSNPLETPRKKLLSAQVELARMDYMEQKTIEQLIYTSSHFGNDVSGKAAFDATPEMVECQHILDLYEDLRKNLAVRVRKRSTIQAVATLCLILAYTAITIPLFLVALALAPFNPVWTYLFHARNHFQPVDLVQKFYARGFLFLCGIKVHWIGMENISYDESTIGMFSHASNLDPVIVASGPLAFKWIGKKSLFRIPIIGWLLTGLEHIPIERENRDKAIASLKRAAEIINKNKRCIAISPEGTRSKSGRIQDFKKGAFHTAMEVGVPITPLLVEGAFELWPSGSIFAQSGSVTVTCLKRITITKGVDSYNSLASKVRRSFYEQLLKTATSQVQEQTTKGIVKKERGKEFANFGIHALWVPVSYAILAIIYTGIRMII